jgi:hypothetical protein
VRKPFSKQPFRSLRRRWQDYIMMDIRETGCEVDETDSRICPMAGFGISSNELKWSNNYYHKKRINIYFVFLPCQYLRFYIKMLLIEIKYFLEVYDCTEFLKPYNEGNNHP